MVDEERTISHGKGCEAHQNSGLLPPTLSNPKPQFLICNGKGACYYLWSTSCVLMFQTLSMS